MSHVAKEALWSPLDADAQAHVASCHECRAQLDDVTFARGLLVEPPPPPPLPASSARRIEAVLFNAAEKRATRLATHLKAEQLWTLGEVEQAHLDACASCSAQLEQVQFARGLLVEPPKPPPLSDASARRIGEVLREAAERQAERRAWWPFSFKPLWVFAPVAAALLAFAAYVLRPAPPPMVLVPVAKQDPVIPAPTPAPIVEAPKAPELAPVKKVLASVTSAHKATAKKAQELSEGATVATSKGGAVWLQLPVGVRAGLLGASKVQLEKLEEKSVTLDVTQGSMVVVARHDPTRTLHVHVGELDVVDVGTRFLVSKDDKRTLVAVEEGEVEVDAPGKKVPVRAGQAVEWRDGKLSQQAWTSEEPKALPVKTAQAPAPVEDTPPIEEKKVTPPAPAPAPAPAAPAAAPAGEPTASSPDEWGTPENLATAAAAAPPPQPSPEPSAALQVPPPPPAPTGAAASAAPAPEKQSDADDETLAQRIERKLRAVASGLARVRSRDDRADDVVRLSNDGQTCNEALTRADLWLGERVPKGESFNTRKSVLRAKLRCLQYQGRTGDALAVQRELERL